MVNWKLFKSQKINKGQVSFEFIIILAVVLILSSAVLIDFYYESNDTFILSAVKATTLSEIYKVSSQANSNCYLNSITMIGVREIQLDIEGDAVCLIAPSVIADSVEKNYCEIPINSDSIIDCTEKYTLTIV